MLTCLPCISSLPQCDPPKQAFPPSSSTAHLRSSSHQSLSHSPLQTYPFSHHLSLHDLSVATKSIHRQALLSVSIVSYQWIDWHWFLRLDTWLGWVRRESARLPHTFRVAPPGLGRPESRMRGIPGWRTRGQTRGGRVSWRRGRWRRALDQGNRLCRPARIPRENDEATLYLHIPFLHLPCLWRHSKWSFCAFQTVPMRAVHKVPCVRGICRRARASRDPSSPRTCSQCQEPLTRVGWLLELEGLRGPVAFHVDGVLWISGCPTDGHTLMGFWYLLFRRANFQKLPGFVGDLRRRLAGRSRHYWPSGAFQRDEGFLENGRLTFFKNSESLPEVTSWIQTRPPWSTTANW